MENSTNTLESKSQSILMMKKGKTTFKIGLHFDLKSKDTLDDKFKKMIRKEVINLDH